MCVGDLITAIDIITVAKPHEHIKRDTCLQSGHRFCAMSHPFVNQIKRATLVGKIVTNRDGARQIEIGQTHLHKLPCAGDLSRVAHQAHVIDIFSDAIVLGNGQKHSDSLSAYKLSMVEMPSVISSRTLSKTRTVSREVKMVTLFSTAVRRIIAPSLSMRELSGSRVLMT